MACKSTEILNDGHERSLSKNWRSDRFLWKPTAEHYDGVVVLTLQIGKVKSVVVYDLSSKKIKTLIPRPHVGNEPAVGDAWADYKQDGAWYQKNYPKGILVKVTYTDKSVRTFKLTCPKNKSDGK